MTTTHDSASTADAIALAVEALAVLVSWEEDALTAALAPLEELMATTSSEVALLVVAQLCAGVVLGCADLLDVDAGRLVRDVGAAVMGPDAVRPAVSPTDE